MENNLEKEFVTYEQAKSLKGLKFDEPCFGYYVDVEVPNPFLVIKKISDTQGGYFTFAPLKQQVFRWFRKKYGLYQIVEVSNVYKGSIKWIYSVCNINGSFEVGNFNHDIYQEAENACIDKLIEIAKQQDNGMEVNN
jgi:hypothetical protein